MRKVDRRKFLKLAVGEAFVVAGAAVAAGGLDSLTADPPLSQSSISKYGLGGGGGASGLADLSDVHLSNPQIDGEVLKYVATTRQWTASPLSGSDSLKLKVTSLDTTEDFLNPKVAAGTGITKTVLNPGANEQLEIAGHLRLHALSDALDHSGAIIDSQHGVRTLANAHKFTDLDFALSNLTSLATRTHASLQTIGANDHHAQSHVLDPGDHTISGKTAGQSLRATSATAFAFEAVPFSVEGTVLSPAGAINMIVLRALFACTVTALKGYRVGGTGATVNAGKGTTATPTNKILASDLSLTSTETWMDGGSVQNTAFAVSDPLILIIASIAGSPTQIGIQVDFTRP